MKVKLHFLRVLSVVVPLLAAPALNAQIVEIYDTPGTGNWTVPCGVTSVTVHLYGGGGGGGGSSNNSIGGGGGGAGGYVSWTFPVVPGNIISYEVGAGGAGGIPTGAGGPGLISRWDGGVLFATGGTPGFPQIAGGTGGTGGTASAWANDVTGGNGLNGTSITGGQGGSAGGVYGGAGGVGGPVAVSGAPGNNYGAGGGGGGRRNGPNYTNGGAGAPGAVILEYTTLHNYPDAGLDVSTCNVVFLQGNTPSAGWTGTWSIVSGAPIIANINDPNSQITIPVPGTCATVRWTFSMAGCVDIYDEVTICYPLICNDDPCGAIAVPVGTSCSPTVYTNVGATATTGLVEPGCGTYQGNDVWYSMTVPANGVLTVELADAAGGPAMEMGLAFYEGPTCNVGDLQHHGCEFYDAANLPDVCEMTYSGTPGSTVYVRVWDANGLEDSYELCAYTHTNPSGGIVEGANTVPCGSTTSFFDPGGDGGNYSNSTGATYTICPSVPGQYVSIDFSGAGNFFGLDPNSNDYMVILDGANDSAYVIGQWTGNMNPGTITSAYPDGCLTVAFSSDIVGNTAGWEASITCSATPGTHDTICSATNCSGGCGQWICQTGLYPTENNGNAWQDIGAQNAGCLDPTAGEIAAHWFYFTALTTGTVEFAFDGPNGQDYNLAVWGPSTNGIPPCPQTTGQAPVLCSQADVQNTGNPVGISQVLGGGQSYEGPEGDGWVQQLNVVAGETYAMMLNIFQNGNPQPVIDMTIGGTGTLDCTPLFLPVELHSFTGLNQGDENLLTWITSSELNNDYFTVERSVNGFDWEIVGTVDGAGTTNHGQFYQLRDYNPYFPVSYYRLKQTDFDGAFEYSEVISINGQQQEGNFVSALFPNPTESYATFMYNGYNTEDVLNVQVIDPMGKVMYNTDYNAYNGMPATIRTDDLSAGVYQVVFSQGTKRITQKLSVFK